MLFDNITQFQNVITSSTNEKELSYFIMLLESSLDLKVQKGRVDCLRLPEIVMHYFQIQLARIQSETSARI